MYIHVIINTVKFITAAEENINQALFGLFNYLITLISFDNMISDLQIGLPALILASVDLPPKLSWQTTPFPGNSQLACKPNKAWYINI